MDGTIVKLKSILEKIKFSKMCKTISQYATLIILKNYVKKNLYK